MPREEFAANTETGASELGEQPRISRHGRFGGVVWSVLLLMQMAMFAACMRGVWMRPDLEWITWVAAGGAMPMLVMRRIVPPSLLAAEPRLLFALSLALLIAGGVIFTGLRGMLGETLFITLGGFSLGLGLWLSVLGIQGRPMRRERHAILSPSLEGPYLASLARRPKIWLAMMSVGLTSAGVWFAASMWPRMTETAPGVDRSGGEATVSLLTFWLGIIVGGMPVLSRWENRHVLTQRWVLPGVLLVGAVLVGLAPWWPGLLGALPTLLIGYAWARVLGKAAQVLRQEIPQSLSVRVASWLLTGSGAGALAAVLFAFSLARSAVSEGSLAAWLGGPMIGCGLLCSAAAVVSFLLRDVRLPEPETVEGGDPFDDESLGDREAEEIEVIANDRWFDFPALELRPLRPQHQDGIVVEIAYDVPAENLSSFLQAMEEMERVRLEEGAVWWSLTKDGSQESVYHEFFRVESWHDRQVELAREDERARALKLQAFAANDWETMPAEIHYPVCRLDDKQAADGSDSDVAGT